MENGRHVADPAGIDRFMAEIQPFRAWRYAPQYNGTIESLTSPLFDVVSEKQREKLYQNPLNSIHLSVPRGDNPAESARETLQTWKSNGTLARDPLPAIYVYYQYFSLPGSKESFCRKGFICNIRAYDWSEKVLLRHENTIPGAVNDRVDILDATALNVSPTHGLYTDPAFELESYMDESMRNPVYDVEDYQGVRDVLSIIQDRAVIRKFTELLSEKQVILADGHHRYEGSLIYRKKRTQLNPDHDGTEGYNFHMMYLTNTEADDLRILPTHRVINGIEEWSEQEMLAQLAADFTIKPIDEAYSAAEIIAGKPWCFALITRDNAWKLRLKPERILDNPWKFPDVIKKLDLTAMHYFIIEKVLNIPGRVQRSSPYISFDRSFGDCLSRVQRGEAQMALITNGITMDEVKTVCYSGYTLPQKSTYFYPKALCGYLFSSIDDEEFQQNHITCL